MISPSYSLTATERVLPRMALDFTTAILDSRVAITRSGNTATVTNSSGVIVGINANLPRFDFDPTTLVCEGLLIEEARTNSLLNSLIDGTDLATQLVTVTAVAQTFSFYGTGTVVLSGAHSATVVGTGAYPTRTILTFTPSAGVLTLTVTGTVQYAQLEVGSVATSFVPTEATAVTRNADVATMTGTNFSDWYNSSEGSFVVAASADRPFPSTVGILSANNGAVQNRITIGTSGASNVAVGDVRRLNVSQAFLVVSDVWGAASKKASFAYKADNFKFAANASAVGTDVTGTPPTVDRLSIGAITPATGWWNGHIQSVMYFPQALTAAEVQAFSK